jgi:hypothetical protein
MPGLPSFKDFLQGMKDDPKSTVMYIAFGVIVSLFSILQASSKKTTNRLEKEIANCNTNAIANAFTAKTENEQMRDKLIDVMGDLKELKGEIKTLKKLGIIKE